MMRGRTSVCAFLMALAWVNCYSLNAGDKKGTESPSDSTFVLKASESGMAEVALAKLAQSKAESEKVRAFAIHMLKDHEKANEELMKIAKTHNLELATQLSKECKEKQTAMMALKGSEFDRAYMDDQVKAHQEAVKLFTMESEKGSNADLKAFASKTLPVIQMHLRKAEEIAGKARN
jgi:putative membrane protein